jgi:hypothetical protein
MNYITLKKRVPIKKLLDGFGFTKWFLDNPQCWNTGDWHQFNEPDNNVRVICSQLLGFNVTADKFDCILHIGDTNVCTHKDNISASVYLIPLRFTKTMLFYEEDQGKFFKKGYGIRFNDYNNHGIINNSHGKFLIISVSRN